jgi:steroid 5-alpha reductase family enzyme
VPDFAAPLNPTKEARPMKADRKAALTTPIVVLLAADIAWVGSQGGAKVGAIPVFALAVGLVFLIQWIVFIPAYRTQSERFYDLTGGLTYISVTLLVAALSAPLDARSILLVALVMLWAGRLGTFLFRRVLKAGKDGRFDDIKPSFVRFLNAWTIQALWITLTAGAALAAITSGNRVAFDVFAVIGLCVWLVGFTIEATADLQKNRFRSGPANKGRFIHTGLWSWSRHPNYFGEITLWVGVALIAFPALQGWQLVTLISPVFVFLLITRVSGVPLLEKYADETWGGQEDYEAYKASTSVLVPLPPRR